LKGTKFGNDPQLQYLFVKGLAGDVQAKVMAAERATLAEAIEKAWSYYMKPRPRLR